LNGFPWVRSLRSQLFVEALGLVYRSQLRYLTLRLMLGALHNNRMAILGIDAGLLALSNKLSEMSFRTIKGLRNEHKH
jgi:hypothetical protein